jgi:hypothetical protein
MTLEEKLAVLRDDVRIVLGELKPVVDSASQVRWKPSEGYLRLIRRATLSRQYDCLDSIAHLVEHERGYAAVYLLRPSCEELIWAKYLVQIEQELANELLQCLVQKEIFENLKAQDDYTGRTVTKESGLLNHLEKLIVPSPR